MLKRFLFCASIIIAYAQMAIASTDSLTIKTKPALVTQSSTAIKVGVHDFRPIAWKTPNGDIKGITPYLATQLLRAWKPDTTPQFKLESSKRMIKEVLRGQTDLIYSISHPKLEANAIKIKRITTVPLSLWSLAEDPIRDPRKLNNVSIATLPIYTGIPYLKNANIMQLPVSKDFLRLLQSRRVKGIITFPALLELMIANQEITRDKFHRLDIANIDVFLWLSKKSPLAKHAEALKAIAEEANSAEVLSAYLKKMKISPTPACSTNASAQLALSSHVTPCH